MPDAVRRRGDERPVRPSGPGARHRARPGGHERTVVRAEVPATELVRYAVELRAMTSGAGTFGRDVRPLRPDAVAPGRPGAQGARQGITPRQRWTPGGAVGRPPLCQVADRPKLLVVSGVASLPREPAHCRVGLLGRERNESGIPRLAAGPSAGSRRRRGARHAGHRRRAHGRADRVGASRSVRTGLRPGRGGLGRRARAHVRRLPEGLRLLRQGRLPRGRPGGRHVRRRPAHRRGVPVQHRQARVPGQDRG